MDYRLSIYKTSGIILLMSIIEWLVENMGKLHEAGVDSPRRDCLVLLEDTLQKNRAWVISHPEYDLSPSYLDKLNKLIGRRLKREPLAYIRGRAWFYGRFFSVTPKVMIPRPESESFIEIIKDINPGIAVDIGTGSGCLAVTVKLEVPDCCVFAYDIDRYTLEVAKKNAKKHGVDIEFNTSNLLDSVSIYRNTHSHKHNKVSALIANLPYVPDGLITSKEILYEPTKALFSGKDGLKHYRKLWEQIPQLSSKPQHIVTESLEKQHVEMTNLAKTAGYKLIETKVLVQHFERVN